MNTTNNGGPAFPALGRWGRDGQLTEALQDPGMTLRDYFAAKAISSMLAPNPVTGQFALVDEFEYCAINAYKMADAMLKARGAKTSSQPEALRIAAEFDLCVDYDCPPAIYDVEKAAAELRRLQSQRDELLAALHLLVAGIENNVSPTFIPLQMARTAIAKAEASK